LSQPHDVFTRYLMVRQCLFYSLPAIFFFFFNDPPTTEIYTLSLHDALPIFVGRDGADLGDLVLAVDRLRDVGVQLLHGRLDRLRSEEHTSELQSPCNLVCRLLLEKKKKNRPQNIERIEIYPDSLYMLVWYSR